ncbi:MAG: hypothetical protein QME41_06740 [Actinomycetota bacterium]|nr:hypothetical protein [Actinomycetota bacterium]
MAVRIAAEDDYQPHDRPNLTRGERVERMLDSFMRLFGSFVERILIPFMIVAGIIIVAQVVSALLSGRL